MAGIKVLSKVQFGLEAPSGLAVPATAVWRGERGDATNLRTVEFIPEDVGYIGGLSRTMVPSCGVEIKPAETPATFEQFPVILATAVEDIVAGTPDGIGSGRIYQYDLPTTVVNDVKTLTMEYGDDTQAYESAYCFCTEFNLRGEADGAVRMAATWRGRDEDKCVFTDLSPVAVEEILFNKGILYIDDAEGYIGDSPVSCSLVSFALAVKTGWVAKVTADGELYFCFIQQTGPEVTLEITFEHNASAVAERDKWLLEAQRQIRLEFIGSALATPGTAYTYKTLRVDLSGKWENFGTIGDRDGNDIVTGTFRARIEEGGALFGQFIVVNELAAILT